MTYTNFMNQDQARQRSHSAPALDVDAPHIMVVDDDDRLRKLLRRYLCENGFDMSNGGAYDNEVASLYRFRNFRMVGIAPIRTSTRLPNLRASSPDINLSG